jgi:flagellar assembly factor FliW
MPETKAITVTTANFGELEVPQDKVIYFREGIPGFPQIQKFTILEFDDLKPFQYLQSLGDPPIALLVVNPFLLHPNYHFDLGSTDMEDIRAEKPEDVTVFAVATIPENPADATINLMAPILLNEKSRCGKQVILLDSDYSVRHPLLSGGEQNTGNPE